MNTHKHIKAEITKMMRSIDTSKHQNKRISSLMKEIILEIEKQEKATKNNRKNAEELIKGHTGVAKSNFANISKTAGKSLLKTIDEMIDKEKQLMDQKIQKDIEGTING